MQRLKNEVIIQDYNLEIESNDIMIHYQEKWWLDNIYGRNAVKSTFAISHFQITLSHQWLYEITHLANAHSFFLHCR